MLKYISLKEEHAKLIFKWRLMPHVTKFLCTDIDEDFEKHKNWVKSKITDQHCKYWLIIYEKQSIGLVYITEIDFINCRCKLGFYIGEKEYIGLGGLFLPPVYDYIFGTMRLNKIYGEVLNGNELIMQIHKYHGWRKVGTHKNHIVKKSIFYDIHLFELVKDGWLNKQNTKLNKYNVFIEK